MSLTDINFNLNIGTWNIHGLNDEKIKCESFKNFLSKMHLIGIVETWCDSGESFDIPGFIPVCHSNRIKHKKARRNSGGVELYIKEELNNGIKKQNSSHKDIIWAKLDKKFFNMKKDTYIGIIYFSPEKKEKKTKNNKDEEPKNKKPSSKNIDDIQDRYAYLLRDIEHYSKLGDILLQGDFNGYTNTNKDFIIADNRNFPLLEDKYYKVDKKMIRNNTDPKLPNPSGKLLLELCKESGLRIVNGRTNGDLQGKFTCYTYNGCSTVDYAVASIDLIRTISTFKVHELTPLSDHCPISCTLLTCFKNTEKYIHKPKLDPLPGKFIWNEEAINNYTTNIQSQSVKQKLNDFLIKDYKDCDEAVNTFNTILYDTAKSSAKFIRRNQINNVNKKYKKPYYTDSCHDLKITVKKYCWLVNKHPENGAYRKEYYSYKSKYRRLCKKEEKNYKTEVCDKISQNIKNDPQTFWNLINKLNRMSEDKSDQVFNETEFTTFFKKLNLSKNDNNSFHNTITRELKDKLIEMNNNRDEHILNNEFTTDEIIKAIKTIKNGKSAGIDYISNEMIKPCIQTLVKPLCKLFNLIFQSGNFPKIWNESYISLIHKKGDKSDPNNYRGISITSNLGKLFNKIVHNRLYNFIEMNNLISKNQIGFKPKARTADHIFTLKSIVDNYKLRKKKVFTAFIDLKKAFDTVWRDGLFYILINHKIPYKLFNIIHSMYQNTNCRIKFPNGLSPHFPSTCGVKQGDVLSPTLFNIFINGLISELDNRSINPIAIGDINITALMYADDIILMSETPEGLQKSLNILNNFCISWKLDINKQKSKIMVFNSNGKSFTNQFKIENETLETVKSYCYLGIVFNYTGNLNLCKSMLKEKGRKAWFKIKKTFSLDNSCCVLEKLFDTLVVPILLYGSEVWGISNNYKDSSPYESLHLKFMKEILGVNCKTSNIACLAETNRVPLHLKVQTNIIKFLIHILKSTESLVYEIFMNVKHNSIWMTQVKNMLNKLGFGNLNSDLNKIESHQSHILLRIQDQYKQSMNSSLTSNGKLSFYRKVHIPHKRLPYLDIIKNKSDRSIISKFRTSSHILAVEKGRHNDVDRSQRLCISCNEGEVEDEHHFFSKCPHYYQQRTNFIKTLKKYIKVPCTNIPLSIKIISILLNNTSRDLLKITIKYMKDCWQHRVNNFNYTN